MDKEALIRSFREVCEREGVDPDEGANSFQAVDAQTRLRKADWYAVAEARVVAHSEKHPLRYDNGRGEADPLTVAQRSSRQWWARQWFWSGARSLHRTFVYHNTPYERFEVIGQALEPTEIEAVKRVREQAKALQATVMHQYRRQQAAVWRGLVKEVLVEARVGVTAVALKSSEGR